MLLAAVLLAGVNMITRGPIAQQNEEAAMAAQYAALPGATTFTEKVLADYPQAADYPLVQALYEAKAGETVVGYALTAAPQGYGGPIPITLGVGVDGAIHGIQVGALQETSGLGSKVGEAPFLNQFPYLAADPKAIDAQVHTISGATVSSGPFKEAVRQMTAFTTEVLSIAPSPGTPPLTGRVEVQPFNLISLFEGFEAIGQVYRNVDGVIPVGYTFDLAPKGFADVIRLRAAMDDQGTIQSVTLVEQHESEGYGARLATAEGEPFFAGFTGKSSLEPMADVDVLSGATVSSTAVIDGVKQAAAFYTQYLAPKPDPDAGIAFEDVTLPTPDDYKAVQSAQRGTKDGALAFYRFIVRVTGYNEASPLMLQIDVDEQGNYRTLTPISQEETPGIGADVFTNVDFAAQFLQKPAATGTADAVQAVSHATLTSEAIQRALKQTARAYASIAQDSAPAEAAPVPTVSFPTVPGAFEGAAFESIAFQDADNKFPTVKSIEEAVRDGALVGYRLVTVSTGYNETDKITLQIEVDAAGAIADVRVLAQAETAGMGEALLTDPAYVARVVGAPAAPESADAVQAVSGSTLTGDAFRKGIRQAMLAYQAVKGALQ
ncbi:MAG: FMN-binding protein, partial [Oscillospiraceae bacterium]|jgi:electron transport complex protein RnfG|nr:FMN-binding protein [Oscillospiraceae bacterium]